MRSPASAAGLPRAHPWHRSSSEAADWGPRVLRAQHPTPALDGSSPQRPTSWPLGRGHGYQPPVPRFPSLPAGAPDPPAAPTETSSGQPRAASAGAGENKQATFSVPATKGNVHETLTALQSSAVIQAQ